MLNIKGEWILFKFICYFVCLSCLVSGCSTVGVTKIASSPDFPAKPDNCDIQVFMNPHEIHRKYVELCEIDVRTGHSIFNDTSAAGAIKEAKPKACEQGCDAIIVDSAGTGYVTGTRGIDLPPVLVPPLISHHRLSLLRSTWA
jgi:hypothetical protein